MENQFVSYIRVSTQKQGKSGLGLAAQRQAINDFLNDRGTLLQEFKEVESGKSTKNRPILKEALAYCSKHKATLVVARLDRLARNVAFVSALMESRVEFVCVDFPSMDKLTIHLLSAVAEHEREIISRRIKDALGVLKAKGVKLGNPQLRADNQVRTERADEFAQSLKGTLEAFRAQAFTQENMIVELNRMGVKAPQGGNWGFTQLRRVLKRIA